MLSSSVSVGMGSEDGRLVGGGVFCGDCRSIRDVSVSTSGGDVVRVGLESSRKSFGLVYPSPSCGGGDADVSWFLSSLSPPDGRWIVNGSSMTVWWLIGFLAISWSRGGGFSVFL